jgi:hypothetical protein
MKTVLSPKKANGREVPSPNVQVLVKNHRGEFEQIELIFDTGSDFTTIPRAVADKYQIAYAPLPVGRPIRTSAGDAYGHPGELTIRIGRWEATLKCYFLEPPKLPPGRRPRPMLPVLGRADFLDRFKVSINGDLLTIAPRFWWDRIWCYVVKRVLVARETLLKD